jgi:tetratricopeptide (TPR) repeat protein
VTRGALPLVVILLASALRPLTLIAQDPLSTARDLYASASYEAALSALTAIDSTANKEDPVQIDTYRALCFLALGRTKDAESTLEQIVVRRPTYMIDDKEHSPRIVTMFRDVRRRALPTAAQQLYFAAKTQFDAKDYAAAATQFKQLLGVLDAPDAGDQAGKLADIKELAAGFLTLSEGRLRAEQPTQVASAVCAGCDGRFRTAAGGDVAVFVNLRAPFVDSRNRAGRNEAPINGSSRSCGLDDLDRCSGLLAHRYGRHSSGRAGSAHASVAPA